MPVEKTWVLQPPSPAAADLAVAGRITPLQAQLLINRGIRQPAAVHDFLVPRLGRLADPFSLRGMEAGVATIVGALDRREPVAVYGDYDADGLTATALLLRFFSLLDIPARAYVPDRLQEGYGLHAAALRRLAQEGVRLLITVDCGTGSQEKVRLARELGMQIVVTDHHQVPTR